MQGFAYVNPPKLPPGDTSMSRASSGARRSK